MPTNAQEWEKCELKDEKDIALLRSSIINEMFVHTKNTTNS